MSMWRQVGVVAVDIKIKARLPLQEVAPKEMLGGMLGSG